MLHHFLRTLAPKPNPITFIQSGNAQTAVNSGANFTLTLSTAPSQNDLIIIVCSSAGPNNNLVNDLTNPTGFTEAGENTGSSIYVAYKVAGASEGTSYVMTNTSAGVRDLSGYIVVYRYAAWDTIGTSPAGGTSVTVPAITVASNNSLLFIYGRAATASANFTTPSTFTDLYEDGDATAPSIYIGNKSVDSGTTGTFTFTTSTSSTVRALLFAIKPA